MNDMYVEDYCQTKIHCRGYVFTISELFDMVQVNCTDELVEAHKEKKDEP